MLLIKVLLIKEKACILILEKLGLSDFLISYFKLSLILITIKIAIEIKMFDFSMGLGTKEVRFIELSNSL